MSARSKGSADATAARKADHLRAFRDGTRSDWGTTWLECVRLVHHALPEMDLDEIDLSAGLCDHTLAAPIVLTGMTGGTPEAGPINRALARLAGEMRVAFGLGSMRAMIEDPALAESYEVRGVAPGVFLMGNLGGTQLLSTPSEVICTALDRVGANAICVHLNPAQECMQPEGDRHFQGVLTAIECLVLELNRPVIVKETGSGISREMGLVLKQAGVRTVDVAGCGGTSWVGVEIDRRGSREDPEREAFRDWGLPTAAAVCELAGTGLEVIASGGIRTGLDAARAIALGADLVGVAAPVLRAYFQGGPEGCRRWLDGLITGLRTAMLLTGSRTLDDLRSARRFIAPPLREWCQEFGLDSKPR